jgi:S1-C subfamily serine protease
MALPSPALAAVAEDPAAAAITNNDGEKCVATSSAVNAFQVGTSGPVLAVCAARGADGSLGFSVAGGADDLAGAAFVCAVDPLGGAARGGLRVGDRLLAVGDVAVLDYPHAAVEAALATAAAAAAAVVLVIQRLDDHQCDIVF